MPASRQHRYETITYRFELPVDFRAEISSQGEHSWRLDVRIRP